MGTQRVEDRLQELRQRPVEVSRDLAGFDPGPLWERGKTWQRRRRIGTLVGGALALVLAIGVGVVGVHLADGAEQIQPVRSQKAVGLPDAFVPPTHALPAYPRERAVTASIAWDDKAGYGQAYAVSAETGAYGALDLPGLSHHGVSLSPDGRYLAWWRIGPTTGEPVQMEGGLGTVGAIAVTDLTTGELDSQQLSTPHGAVPQSLDWTPQGELMFTSARYAADSRTPEERAESVDPRTMIADEWGYSGRWSAANGFSVGAMAGADLSRSTAGQRPDGSYLSLRINRLDLRAADGTVLKSWRNGLPRTRITFGVGPVVDASGSVAYVLPRRLQGTDGVIGEDGPLRITQLDESTDTLTWRTVGKARDQWALGWRNGQVLVNEAHGGAAARRLSAVDPDTGERTVLSTGWLSVDTYAQDIVSSAPTVPGVAPGRAAAPGDPERQVVLAGGGALGALALAGLGVLVWRRRVHA